MELRPYQSRIAKLTLDHLREYPESRPVVVAPCGAGKSVLIARLIADLIKITSGTILVLSHRKEILAQNAAKLPAHLVGIFSAGLGKKQLGKRVVVAGMQSLRNHINKMPRVDIVIIDECHVAGKAYAEMLKVLEEKNPVMRVVGYSGTPFLGDANRTLLHLLPADKRIFTGICAEISIGELLDGGYLVPLTPYRPKAILNTDGVAIDTRTGDFQQGALQAAVDTDDLNAAVVGEMISIIEGDGRKHTLVFCTGVDHATHIRDRVRATGRQAEMILGNTPAGERADLIEEFRAGKLPWLVSVEAMTTGFDAPVADSIVMLRPTFSAVMWMQMLGRVQRPHETKSDALVVDFTVNSTETFPPIDEIEGNPPRIKEGQAPVKHCPDCFSICLAGLRICPTCGFEFPPPEEHGDARQFDPTTGLLVSGVVKNEDGSRTYPVARVDYEVRNTSAGAPALVARYMSEGRATPVATEFYNMWHHKPGVAQRDSLKWLRRLHTPGPVPLTAQEAHARAEMGALKTPRSVTVRPGSPFPVRFSM